ncbi:2-oxoglutarate dehydrogenase E1 component [Trinickia terrae]|uniref:oxoglutarate dehydrogenase (succinyl-transferring) n=1 Tax=Trinickia terrae TaxID=2571161 RepID=A0A4U1HZL6_9BURK|nr:2-oxoglutarate dehydrogenase E1 component [Trinickia terrae]TKC86034.1 2-oxoglutarate dehydrogenase E1 component [Trinickia terrae]
MSTLHTEYADASTLSPEPSPLRAAAMPQSAASPQVARFIDAYREQGHRCARLDPLALAPLPALPALKPDYHGLHPLQERASDDCALPGAVTVQELARQLERTYCDTIGLDCSGIRSKARRGWLFARMEADLLSPPLAPREQGKLLQQLLAAEMWERHVARSQAHAKRFSLEGCESLVPLLEALVTKAVQGGVRQVFLGMPHRGRLNVLVNLMGFDVESMLQCLNPDSDLAALQRDLPYHLGGAARMPTAHGEAALFLAHNPSHLQSVFPVVSGMARAYQDEHPESPCLPVVVHGDAAFAGQGIVAETLNLTRRNGYALGGTIHVIVNNQVGFTTPNRMNVEADDYCTDVARMIDAPVIRVNADHPEAVLRAASIAFDYRRVHGADVVIDLIGYRRLGHSEHDIPSLTQPFVQAAIASHPTVTELYHAAIAEPAPLAQMRDDALQHLLSRPGELGPFNVAPADRPAASRPLQPLSHARLRALTAALATPPEGLLLHEFVRNLTDKWNAAASSEDNAVDWPLAENAAYASLLEEGHGIRLSGMDVGRGTFMHRHAVWHAQPGEAGGAAKAYVPLAHIAAGQGRFDIVNSPLTEEAVLGYEYGYSVQTKTRLTIWEAQFGDFVNGAQVIIDQYIAPGEYKWGYRSALTILLPHGHEGVGPEHSSGFLGRFLQLCAGQNLRVAVPSTSAQWFHLLREQAAAEHAKPLVVMSPKTQLYSNRRSHAPLRALANGAFMPVLPDSGVRAPEQVTRVVLCSGKFFYELEAARDEAQAASVAVIRVEQLYPFPKDALMQALAAFPNLAEVVWAQEEDRNQGAWRFVRDDLEACVSPGCRLAKVCRTATASGAHASIRGHQIEQRRLVKAALLGPY